MREVNLNVDYALSFVPEIQEDLDVATRQRCERKKAHNLKSIIKNLSKDVKKKSTDYFKNKDTYKK